MPPVSNTNTPDGHQHEHHRHERRYYLELALAMTVKLALLAGLFFLIRGTIVHVDVAGMAAHIDGNG
ncbi:MAG: hypothetical protein H6865_08530 [Rhodospirillales bacterium]|nr:hypothetical protein [Alphaproteobacteria bacterium]MCB9987661.1 hypothetical protein [Rhodospirillales bacterium]USO08040.1 MAG: hypothetical protein H6866_02145 [Rhodospirillales bacterium]